MSVASDDGYDEAAAYDYGEPDENGYYYDDEGEAYYYDDEGESYYVDCGEYDEGIDDTE
eukprot:CAMPEP_0201553788 /NCGR_PEP_ID=MMETSP0173_2-20130828/33574_1 /ASSEMBLY_ACC=CAM_ASM_000268 /TAXON_ID=218659 /ORGANISM="Vexillifera sp., Strain DIVA3 564/2" /LENGTH=58 /DNA_ID=CAMNT_0047964777 /DNA_START=12 /DNA_END=185 /DNA_ORIENTATION=+